MAPIRSFQDLSNRKLYAGQSAISDANTVSYRACADGSEKQGDYSLRAYKTVDGKNITVADMCWTSGGYQPNLGDMMAAQCLLGLHQNQKTTCIDLAGSPCDGFAGSAIGNVEVYSGFSGDPNQQPDKNSVDRMNAAFGTVQGLAHGWDIGSTISIAPINDDGTETGWTALIRGTGASNC